MPEDRFKPAFYNLKSQDTCTVSGVNAHLPPDGYEYPRGEKDMNAVVTSTDIKTLLKLALPIGSRLITKPEINLVKKRRTNLCWQPFACLT